MGKDQLQQVGDIVEAFLPDLSKYQKMFSEQHPSAPTVYYKVQFLAQANLKSISLQEVMTDI